MRISVIGVGFGRTGTLSLKYALEQLGIGPCYHMRELYKNADTHGPLWLDAAEGEHASLRQLLSGYRATVDWPGTFFWRDLLAMNPEAQVVLTVRDSDTWYASASQTIFPSILRAQHPSPWQQRVASHLVLNGTFKGRHSDREEAIRIYEAHIDEVMATVAPERLLVYELGSGWEPLCAFLGMPIPDEPFPVTNSREAFRQRRQLAHGSQPTPL